MVNLTKVFKDPFFLASWLMATIAVVILLPYVALSTYGFFTLDDLVLYTRVQDNGLLDTILWYYNVVSGRVPVFFIHGLLSFIVDLVGGNPWFWNRVSSVLYFIFLVGSFSFFFRTLLPAISWPLAVVLGTLPYAALMTFQNPFNEQNEVLAGAASEQLWTYVLAIYGVSFAMYVAFISGFLIFLTKKNLSSAYSIFICTLFFIFSMTHEISIIPLGFFLIFVFLLSLDYRATGKRFSHVLPLSNVRIGVAIRPDFDNRLFILVILAMGCLLILSALIQVLSPSVAARDSYWPARMSIIDSFLTIIPMIGEFFRKMFNFEKPFMWLLFGLFFFVARTTSLRKGLQGRNRKFLLIPVIVFLIILVVGMTTSMIMASQPIPRVQHYLMSYGVVAVSCLAIFSANILKLYWLSKKMASIISVIIFAGIVVAFAAEPWYRLAVDVAVDEGYEYSQGIAKREEILSSGRNQVVRINEIELPPPFVQPVIHWADTEIYFQELLAKSFGQRKVLFVPCSDSNKPNVCHYLARSELGPMPVK